VVLVEVVLSIEAVTDAYQTAVRTLEFDRPPAAADTFVKCSARGLLCG
jgi:hypothetical protein